MFLFALSFAANLVITSAVAAMIWRNHPAATEVYGPDAPARRILACVYLTIGLISGYGLLQLAAGSPDAAYAVALVLFPLQIIYKLMTAIALWVFHPVVMANLGVVGLLVLTLVVGR